MCARCVFSPDLAPSFSATHRHRRLGIRHVLEPCCRDGRSVPLHGARRLLCHMLLAFVVIVRPCVCRTRWPPPPSRCLGGALPLRWTWWLTRPVARMLTPPAPPPQPLPGQPHSPQPTARPRADRAQVAYLGKGTETAAVGGCVCLVLWCGSPNVTQHVFAGCRDCTINECKTLTCDMHAAPFACLSGFARGGCSKVSRPPCGVSLAAAWAVV